MVDKSSCSETAKAMLRALIAENFRQDLRELTNPFDATNTWSEARELMLLELQNLILKTCPKYEPSDIGPG
jgi:hypothetical protein